MQLAQQFNTRRAVLISGGVDQYLNYPRYLNDLKAFYACLVSPRYGFSSSDIQVVYANGGMHDLGGNLQMTQHATKQHVTDALDRAVTGGTRRRALGHDDLLVVLTTNHGQQANKHRLRLWGAAEYFESTDLGQALAASSDYHFLGIFGHCLGASMTIQVSQNVTQGKYIVAAASTGASFALPPDDAYDAFLYHFTAALRGFTPSNYPANSDTNGDGHIDIGEAFSFAKMMDQTADIPYLDDGASGISSKLTLNGLLP